MQQQRNNSHAALKRGNVVQKALLPNAASAVVTMETPSSRASALLIQNLVRLCSDLRLPVAYKVNEVEAAPGADIRTFYIVVHVLADNAFKKYLQHCSQSDLMLFRGLLLKVTTNNSLKQLHSAQVQQAFLPKFENEGQDASIADAIVAGAGERFMVATIKHSGSLVTLSGAQGFAAKNSLDNEFTAGAAALLQAHYLRLCKGDATAAGIQLDALMRTLRSRRMALSFEMVTGCHGHHGQLPAAEYLVATSAHTLDAATGRPMFLPWLDFMSFCLQQGLPVNDAWLFAGKRWAAAARDALDDLAIRGGPTATAMSTLSALVEDGKADGCLHLPGTYPHDQWQGSRIEGFVVSQGQATDPASTAALEALLPTLREATLPLGLVPEPLRQPYRRYVEKYNGDAAKVQEAVAEAARAWLPSRKLSTCQKEDKDAVVALLSGPLFGLSQDVRLSLPEGGTLYSRRSLAASKASTFQQLASELGGASAADDKGRAALLRLLQQAAEGTSQGGGKHLSEAELKVLMVQLVKALAGSPEVHHTLRYKKKMTMWSYGSDSAAGAAGAPPSDAVMGYCMMTFVLRNGIRALNLSSETYHSYVSSLVRNWDLPKREAAQVQLFARAWVAWVEAHGGTAKLREASYLDFAEPFVAEFLRRRGDMPMAGVVSQRPEGSFQGVLVLVDTPPGLAERVQQRLFAQHLVKLDGKQNPPFAKSAVRQGMVVWSPEGSALPKTIKAFADEAAPYMFLGVQRLVPGDGDVGDGDWQPAKKQKQGSASAGMQASKLRAFEQALGGLSDAVKRTPPPRKKYLEAPSTAVRQALAQQAAAYKAAQDAAAAKGGADGSAQGKPAGGRGGGRDAVAPVPMPPLPAHAISAYDAVAGEVQTWLGQGAPVAQPDPAIVCCFITIPGTGKTVLTAGLQSAGALAGAARAAVRPGGAGGKAAGARAGAGAGAAPMECDGGSGGGDAGVGFSSLQMRVLNSDTMKATIPGFKPGRYWPEVSDAADTCVGGGSVTLVVADKNLVPSPRGNLERAMRELSDSGASTLAVLPCCSGTSSQALLPELYQGVPDLPWPLEFVALCMLRVLNRRKHEGKLDAESCKEAAGVVCMFAAFYRNMSYAQLRAQVQSVFSTVLELPIMRGIGEPALGSSAPPTVSPKVQELLAHVAWGVSNAGQRSGPELGDAWEAKARKLLGDPEVSAALTGLQRPLGELQGQVASALAARLGATARARATAAATDAEGLDSAPSLSNELQRKLTASDSGTAGSAGAAAGAGALVQAAPGVPPRWIGIAGLPVQPLLDSAAALPLEQAVRERLLAGRPNYHVTLWHMMDPALNKDPALKEALLAAVGQEVAMEVVGIDTCADVTAAQVHLLSAPEEAMQKSYHHITLAVGPKAQPKDANELPARVEAGTAQRLTLPEPLQLVGQILAFTEDC